MAACADYTRVSEGGDLGIETTASQSAPSVRRAAHPCYMRSIRKTMVSEDIVSAGVIRQRASQLGHHLAAVAVDTVGLDWMTELELARSMIQKRPPVQSNRDRLHLLAWRAVIDAIPTAEQLTADLPAKPPRRQGASTERIS
jgi:hypothetical protein